MSDEKLKPIVIDKNTEVVPNIYHSIFPNKFKLPYLPMLNKEIETGEPVDFKVWSEMFENSLEGFPRDFDNADLFEFRCFPTSLCLIRLTTLDESYSRATWNFPGLVFNMKYQMFLKETNLQLSWPSLKELQSYTKTDDSKYFNYLFFFERVLEPKLFKEMSEVLLPTFINGLAEKNVIIDKTKLWKVHHFFVDDYLENNFNRVMKRDSFEYLGLPNTVKGYYTEAEVYYA